jgi:hypothetical protein
MKRDLCLSCIANVMKCSQNEWDEGKRRGIEKFDNLFNKLWHIGRN